MCTDSLIHSGEFNIEEYKFIYPEDDIAEIQCMYYFMSIGEQYELTYEQLHYKYIFNEEAKNETDIKLADMPNGDQKEIAKLYLYMKRKGLNYTILYDKIDPLTLSLIN